ncbi:MAG: DNA methyltransferase [Chloroflexota bacterium]|nr:DNA methyltransferase [Chloroflexota bacterium]
MPNHLCLIRCRQKPIERTFPISEVNRIAEREAHAKRYYRPVYTMHKWWARRLGSVFRTIALYALTDEETLKQAEAEVGADLLTFEKSEEERIWDLYLTDAQVGQGKVVLDPMMGGGTSVVEALRLGANVIGCDLNPVAWFVVKKEIEPVDLDELDAAFEHLKETVAPEILKYYKTTCPVCGREADTMYYFWVKELACTNCGQSVPLFKDYRVASSRSVRVEHHPHVLCPKCGTDFAPTEEELHCPKCGWEFDESGFYHLLCPLCGGMFEAKDYREEHRCPHCGHIFKATEGNASGQYYTCPRPDCRQKYKVVDAIAQLGKPQERLYGVEYYCPHCDLKGYKAADEDDRALYRAAERELAEIGDTLPLPDQEIPDGKETMPRLPNWGYHNFRDMFNARQLLCLGRLLQAIMEIEDWDVKELLLIALSEALETNCMLCRYNFWTNAVEVIFGRHAFYPKSTPCENNLWGTAYGRGNFTNRFDMLREGVQFAQKPFEKYLEGHQLRQRSGLRALGGKLVSTFEQLRAKGNALLLCRSSDFLPLPDNCVDLVLTDPPYYDNVMYSELSDFFYVWLRLALKDRYPHFRAELTPKAEEVVKNSAQGKEEADFLRMLTDIFRECHRVLKRDGLMAFTYHHKQDEAWSAVLKSLLDAEFYVTAAWPIHSEMSSSTHIYDKQNISYDTIIVARPREGEGERISWYRLEQDIHDRAAEIVEYYRRHDGRYLSEPDMGVVAQAKCLELYSKHYPNVMEEEMVEVKEAVQRTSAIVAEQLIEERFQTLVSQTDTLTALYLLFLADRDSITYDALNKLLRGRGADVEDFTDRDLLRSEHGRLRVVSPTARWKSINPTDPELAIDGAHYMIYVREERDLLAAAAPFARRGIIFTLEELAKIKRNEGYQEIADYLKRMQHSRGRGARG